MVFLGYENKVNEMWKTAPEIELISYLHANSSQLTQAVPVPYQSVTFDVTSEWLTIWISPESPITFVLTKQANDSWRACFATRTPPRGAGIKGERVQTHISFSLRSRALQISECLQSKTTALVLRRVSGGCCPVLDSREAAITLLPPLGASALLKESFSTKRANLKELHERRASF